MSSTLWKRWPLRLFLILPNKKSRTERDRVHMVSGPTHSLDFCKKVGNFKGSVHGYSVSVEQPWVVCPQLRPNITNSFAKMSEDVEIQLRIHCGLLGQKFFMDQAFLIEKCNKHCFHLQLWHPDFLRPCFTLTNPLHTLTLSLWIVLEKPWLIAGYHTFENVFWLNCFKPISPFLLFLGKILQNKFSTKHPQMRLVLHN